MAGAGVVAMGLTCTVTLWPDGGSDQVARVVATGGQLDANRSAEALRATAALRAQDRASRSRVRPSIAPTREARPAPLPDVVGKRWVTTDLNIRSKPSPEARRIGTFDAGSRAKITGETKKGWSQVVADGRAGWVKSSYLSKSKPAAPPAAVSDASCSISTDIETHLSSNARAVYRAVCASFGGSVSSFGGYRPGDDGDHGSGRAVDIMVSGDPGWDIARYLQAHAGELNVTYVIYQQKIWMAGNPAGQWKAMEDRGSSTANHFDHVHVSVS